ncbi:thiol peroxidase [Sulfuriferula multivorans]|uniref:thioredoxin-dependent peroxiredoxin n=1 Tax=Sulfuriferula multivorans TaxID=1559896 RepID=A0A401JZY2_9PROT|nr:peroxiredoxin [Sulfuriferula multivorans]GCB02230.1 thiol peroxidase [Sulfuriferula multivorans]
MATITEFELPSTGNRTFKLTDARGKKLVVYFYPKDDTPGCTVEGSDFRDLYAEFQAHHCEIVGISRDDLKSHEKFKTKLSLPFELLSDTDEKVCELFGVMKLKNMYGKEVRGVDRSTFVFDADGKLVKEWRSVKFAGHAQEVLDTVKTL